MEQVDFINSAPNGGSDMNTAAPPRVPLAARMRPRDLSEYVGQRHILAEGKLLRRAIEADKFSSIILSGPPGTGKTSLAEIIANTTNSTFVRLSGVTSTVADIRREVANAIGRSQLHNVKTILFVDEIHRFSKSQQDSLLPDVENGNVCAHNDIIPYHLKPMTQACDLMAKMEKLLFAVMDEKEKEE